jgi:hypothetical protein
MATGSSASAVTPSAKGPSGENQLGGCQQDKLGPEGDGWHTVSTETLNALKPWWPGRQRLAGESFVDHLRKLAGETTLGGTPRSSANRGFCERCRQMTMKPVEVPGDIARWCMQCEGCLHSTYEEPE